MWGMARTPRSGRGTHAARLLGVFAVLLGLLAMHGLASSHHASASAAEHTAAAAQPHDPAWAEPPHLAAANVAAAQEPAGPVAAPAGPSCDDDCAALVTLCVAVLAATVAVAVVLLRRRCRRCALTASADRAVPAPPSARAALPPPDPVRELCVSRT